MAFTKTWKDVEEKPTNANFGYEIDNYMRVLGYAVRERLAIEHNFFADEAGQVNIGMHKIVTLLVQTTITALADAGKIYTKDVGDKAELHFLDEDDNEIQITSAGKILVDSLDGVVKLVGDQTIAGVKTFGDNIVLKNANITTTKFTTGNVAMTNDSVAVVGTGTGWDGEVKAGQAFQIDGETKYYIIASVTDDTHLALTEAYAGSTDTGLGYTIAETVDGKYVAKLANDEDADLGAWVSKSNDTVYQADTDGFVCAYNLTGGMDMNMFTDGDTPPTTVRVYQATSESNTPGATMPVKKDDYWKVTLAGVVFWIPLGS